MSSLVYLLALFFGCSPQSDGDTHQEPILSPLQVIMIGLNDTGGGTINRSQLHTAFYDQPSLLVEYD